MCIYRWNGYETWSVFPKVRTRSEGVWEAGPAGNVPTAGRGKVWELEQNFVTSNFVTSAFYKMSKIIKYSRMRLVGHIELERVKSRTFLTQL
jgi:hypothetical protein